MSASEKLKALDERKHWTIPQWREKYGDEWTVESGRLLAALPQIVAVVEAAEELRRAENDHSWGLQPDGRMKDWEKRHDKNKAQASLDAALTALERSLDGE